MCCWTVLAPCLALMILVWLQLINEVEGVFEISADSKEALAAVNQMIMSLVEEPEQGKIYK